MPLGLSKDQILLTERRLFFFNDAYLYMRRHPFFNDVFIAYLYMHGCLAQQLKINRKYTAYFFQCTLNCTSSVMTPQSTF